MSNNVVCATSKGSDQHVHSLIRTFASHLNILWLVSYWMNSIQFQFLKGGCTGSPVPNRVKMPHCWNSHIAAHILKTEEMTGDSWSIVLRIRQENVGITKEIKLIKIEKRYCKRRNLIIIKTIVFSIVTIINVAYEIRTNNAELKNISVQSLRVLPTEPCRQLIPNYAL